MKATIQKILPYITIMLFLLFLVLPSILYPFVKKTIDSSNTENRQLAEKPVFTLKEIASYPSQYEAYFLDHLAFKKQFVKLNTYVNLKLFGELDSNRVLYGKEDWLFYKNVDDGDPISCYRGTNLFTDEELKIYKEKLLLTRDRLREYGKEFIICISPNKEQVYSEYMPEKIKVVSDFSIADQLVKYLRDTTDLKVVYPLEELLQNRDNYQLYYKNDTHWNELGGFIGAQQLIEVITGSRKYIDELEIQYAEDVTGDLAIMENLQEFLPKDKRINILNYYDEINIESVPKDNSEYEQYISSSERDQSIFIMGTSFRKAMIPYINKVFNRCSIYGSEICSIEDIREVEADVIVMECVERYLSTIPETCDKLLYAYP